MSAGPARQPQRVAIDSRGRIVAFWVFLLSPLAVLTILSVLIVRWVDVRPMRDAAPVGAGAGTTGGANAIGELLSGNRADKAVTPPRKPDQDASPPPADPPPEVPPPEEPPPDESAPPPGDGATDGPG